MRTLVLIVCFLFLIGRTSAADDVVVFSDASGIISIGEKVTILNDSTGHMNVQDVLRSTHFLPSQMNVPNLGVSKSTFWVKFTVKNVTENPDLIIELAQPTTDEVEFHEVFADGTVQLHEMGEYESFKNRNYHHPDYLFDVTIPKDESHSFLLKLRSREHIQLPLYIGTPRSVLDTFLSKELIAGIYSGLILVMFFYNLFIYFTVRDKSYLFYVVYIFLIGLTQLSLQGYTFKYLWPDIPWLARYSLFIFPVLVGVAGMEFVRTFLKTRENYSSFRTVSYFLTGVYALCLVLAFTDYYTISYTMIEMNAMVVAFYLLFVAIKVARKGYRPARFFLLAWSMFLIGIIIFVLKDFGIFPYTDFTRYTMQLGSAIEVVLLSFGLADRINTLKKEKEASQLKALEIVKENERIVKEQNTLLEKSVQERTAELSQTLDRLKETQSQLVSAEKMASLGQLTAGIAHEINNPINFVMSNISPLKRDITDVFSLLSKYEEIAPGIDLEKKLDEIKRYNEELDIPYLREEMDILLNGIYEGASRTSEIVKGMKNFSRLDGYDLKMANINEGLETTLTILRNVIHGKIRIEKVLENIPEIECNPGKLNQVFMNIINNAAQAIMENQDHAGNGLIEIRTAHQGDEVRISVRDNGVGMTEGVRKKVFEPFFTTKEVGVGTGLGLSIAYSIVKSHNGEIRVESEVGKGSLFTISLPVIQPNK